MTQSNPNPKCYLKVTTRRSQQEWYDTSSGDARIRARQVREAGFHVSVSPMGMQVTSVGRVRMTLVTINHGGEVEAIPAVETVMRDLVEDGGVRR